MKTRKFFAILLTLIMLMSLLPISALAANEPQLVVRLVELVDPNDPDSFECIITDFYFERYGTTADIDILAPALLVDNTLVPVDPEKIYSSNEEDLTVVADSDFPGILLISLTNDSECMLCYDHTDGKTYTLDVFYGSYPAAFYSSPEADPDQALTAFEITAENNTVYLISEDEYTLSDLSLEGFPTGSVYSLSDDGHTASIKIGGEFSRNTEAYLFCTLTKSDGTVIPDFYFDLTISANTPGFFVRPSIFREPSIMDENAPSETEIIINPKDSENRFFIFFDGVTEEVLSIDDLKSSDESIVTLSEGDLENIYIESHSLGTADILYTHSDGETYSLTASVELPEVAFYSQPEPIYEAYLDQFELTETNDTVYLAAADGFTIEEYELIDFPTGTVCTESEDKAWVKINIGHKCFDSRLLYASCECYDPNGEYIFELTPSFRANGLSELPALEFTDVKESDWFCESVQWAYGYDVTSGLTETTFGPDETCTRAQVVTFLWAAAGRPEPIAAENPFTDVNESDWFYEPVMWAVGQGITAGVTETEFAPTNTCTRAQVVTFLWAASGHPDPMEEVYAFSDVSEDDWFATPVMWAVENGITSGLSKDFFGPNDSCTRAQVVTFLYANETK